MHNRNNIRQLALKHTIPKNRDLKNIGRLFVPVKVLASTDGDQAVRVGELAEDADIVAILKLTTYRLNRC